jgi:hypothetical protein
MRYRFVLRRWRQIDTSAQAFGHDCHQPRANSPGLALGADLVVRDRHT